MNTAGPGLIVMVGTKAQFIKTAPILLELDRRGIGYRLIYTGQHSETFDALEACFGTRPPDDNLVPGREADTARGLLGWTLRFCLAALVRIRRGDWRGARWGLVHGDTASTLLSAVALRLAGVPVAHVEAGLRSPNLFSPFPEEIVRRLVSRLACLHLAPDAVAASNLAGAAGQVVDTSGNSLRDCLALAMNSLVKEMSVPGNGAYALVSVHRSENLGQRARLDRILVAVVEASRKLPVRFVLHPVTRKRLHRSGWLQRLAAEPGITLMERTDYIEFVRLMLGARMLMTDGGSNQEEAAMLGLPTLLLRTETERVDGLDGGSVRLSGLDPVVVGEFVAQHADLTWVPRALPVDSPSSRIVDAIELA